MWTTANSSFCWAIPVPVMLTVATALLGALLGLWFCGTSAGAKLGLSDSSTLSIYAQLGMVMLIGLTAKNAILMVEFSKQERENGKSVFEAAVNGANLRYRAVLMTAWSFLFGVFPLVVASGAGAGSRRHYHLFRHAAGDADRNHIHTGTLRGLPAHPRVDQDETALDSSCDG